MGQPKALLDFHGRCAIEMILEACQGLGMPIVVTAAPAGQAIRARITSFIDVRNPRPEEGQLSSLQAGLRQLPPDAARFLLFPVDYPLVPATEVQRLVATAGRIVIPSYQRRRGHPVLIDAALASEFLALPPTSSAREVIAAHADEIVYVDAATDLVLLDMDTPEDYRRGLARIR